MIKLRGKRFAASYSSGKDSTLAIHRAVQSGLVPMRLITTHNLDANRSWFHGLSEGMIENAAAALGIPISLVRTAGKDYERNFERALLDAKAQGAEVCVFGDIDIEGHLNWCSQRCENTGLIPCFPLWRQARKALVYEFIDSGFSAVITCIDTTRMPPAFLGQTLTREVADAIERAGADICGENGEYHTLTFNGPVFRHAIGFAVKKTITRDKYQALVLEPAFTV